MFESSTRVSSRVALFLLVGVGLSFLFAKPAAAQVIRGPSGAVVVGFGGHATLTVTIDTPFDLLGFTYGLCHTSTTGAVSITSTSLHLTPGADLAALNGGAGPDFFAPTNPAIGGVPGEYTVGVITSFTGSDFLMAGNDLQVVDVQYQGVQAGTIDVCFCDTLSSPPVVTEFYDAFSVPSVPTQICGVIEVIGDVCDTVDNFSCAFVPIGQLISLTWTNPETYTQHEIFKNGASIAVLAGSATSYDDLVPSTTNEYVIESSCGSGGTAPPDACSLGLSDSGDSNGDGTTDIGDAIYLLAYIFASGPAPTLSECP